MPLFLPPFERALLACFVGLAAWQARLWLRGSVELRSGRGDT